MGSHLIAPLPVGQGTGVRAVVAIGMSVEAVFEDVTDDVALVKFRPAG